MVVVSWISRVAVPLVAAIAFYFGTAAVAPPAGADAAARHGAVTVATPNAAPEPEGDPPVWPFAAGAVIAVAVAAIWATRRKP